jgi:two-component sensor histidine kinase/PAS domain-containing protein
MVDSGRQVRPTGRHGLSIALLLFLFGASLVVPALVFTAVLLDRSWQAQEADMHRRLEQVVGDLAHDVDRELTLLLANLTALAASPDVATGDWAAVHAKASASLKPLGIEVLFRDPDGQQVMNTRVPWGTPLPRSQQPGIDAAVRASLKPHVSDMVAGSIAGRQIITLTVAVVGGEGRLSGSLHMSLDPERLLATMEGQNLPTEWNTGISDRTGTIIARLRRHSEFVGRKLPDELRAQSVQSTSAFSTVNVEGVQTLRAAKVSPLTGWLFSANVPMSMVHAASVKDGQWIIGLGGGLLLLALLLAVALGRLVARPIEAIAGHAAMVAQERMPPPLDSPVREANEVSTMLRYASRQLQERSQALRGTLERFAVALRGAHIVVYAQDRERRVTWISETAGDGQAFIGRRSDEVLPPDSSAEAAALEQRALATGEPQEGEVQHGAGDAARHFRLHIEPVRDSSGEVTGLLGVSSEITALKQSERRNALLAREIAHRAKNLLTIVQAIASETGRSAASVVEFNEHFTARIRALARLQDLAMGETGEGAPLRALVQSQFEAFIDPASGRVSTEGPDVRLTAQAGSSLAIALHELATNAAKYGALANADGRVTIRWQDEQNDATRSFRLVWQESGGPPVAQPQRRGFGTKVLGRLTAGALEGEARLEYRAEGLLWLFVAPWDRVVAATDPPVAAHTGTNDVAG